jgi:hypothetical protein
LLEASRSSVVKQSISSSSENVVSGVWESEEIQIMDVSEIERLATYEWLPHTELIDSGDLTTQLTETEVSI